MRCLPSLPYWREPFSWRYPTPQPHSPKQPNPQTPKPVEGQELNSVEQSSMDASAETSKPWPTTNISFAPNLLPPIRKVPGSILRGVRIDAVGFGVDATLCVALLVDHRVGCCANPAERLVALSAWREYSLLHVTAEDNLGGGYEAYNIPDHILQTSRCSCCTSGTACTRPGFEQGMPLPRLPAAALGASGSLYRFRLRGMGGRRGCRLWRSMCCR